MSKNDDEKVKLYTGFASWDLLEIFIEPFLNISNRSTLSAVQQVIMTLIHI